MKADTSSSVLVGAGRGVADVLDGTDPGALAAGETIPGPAEAPRRSFTLTSPSLNSNSVAPDLLKRSMTPSMKLIDGTVMAWPLLPQRRNRRRDTAAGLFQPIERRRDGYPEVRREAVGSAIDDHDFCVLDQELGNIRVGSKHLAVRRTAPQQIRTADEQVEGALGAAA